MLGVGKTAIDACLWLLANGAPTDAITWVMPRDSWFVNRAKVQAAMPFFDAVFTGIAEQREAMAAATSVDDLALRLEACGAWLRLDPAVMPRMFHYATMAEGELALLRDVRDVVRLGRVRALEPSRMQLDRGEVATARDQDTLFIDCTACALAKRPLKPVFDGRRITLQMIRIPQPTFSAAYIAVVETMLGTMSDAECNRLCAPIPLPDAVEEFPLAQMIDQTNRFHASRQPALAAWLLRSRLDGYAHLVAKADPADAARQALLVRMRAATKASMVNLPRLAAQAAAAA